MCRVTTWIPWPATSSSIFFSSSISTQHNSVNMNWSPITIADDVAYTLPKKRRQ